MDAGAHIELLEAISQIQSAYILDTNPIAAFKQLLNTLLELTQSEYGFIGEIRTSEQGRPFLKTRAITNIAWNKETLDFYNMHAPALEFHNLDTLFGHVITSGTPVISNCPNQDPRRGGLPKGHPPLQSFLGTPIHFGEQLIGMVGLANRPSGYDGALITFLSPLLNTCAVLLKNLCTSEQKEELARRQQSQTAHLQAILDSALDGILTIDTDGLIESATRSAEQLFGYSSSEMLGREIQSLFPLQEQATIKSRIRAITYDTISSSEKITKEIAGRRKDGSLFPAKLSLAKFCVNDRVLFAVAIHDETEHRLAQLSLQESEQHLREAQALSQVGSLTWHIDTDRQTWSDQLYRLLGYTPGAIEPTFETIKSIIHPEDAAAAISTFEAGIKKHDCLQLEFRIIIPGGQVRYIQSRAVIDRSPDQTALRMRAAFIDVTAERLAIHSHKILTYAIDHGMEGLALLDREGRFIYMNPAHAAIYGFSVQELLGKTWREMYVSTEIEYVEREVFPQLIQKGSWSGELIGRMKSGEAFDVEISLCLLAGPIAGGSEFLVCTCRNITLRKQAEAAIKQYNEQLEARVQERTAELANTNAKLLQLSRALVRAQEKERRRMAADLHDEIGQSLTALNINLQVLRQDHLKHPKIEDSFQLSGTVLNQIRELAMTLRPQLLDEFGLEEAVRIYAERQAERNGWTLHFHLDGDYCKCGDEAAVTCFRIIQESLTNTARHAKADSVTVNLTFLESSLSLTVIDNGIGFDYPTVSSRKRIPGTGLAAMRERIELTGGTFTLITSPGQGTHIQAEIPIVNG